MRETADQALEVPCNASTRKCRVCARGHSSAAASIENDHVLPCPCQYGTSTLSFCVFRKDLRVITGASMSADGGKVAGAVVEGGGPFLVQKFVKSKGPHAFIVRQVNGQRNATPTHVFNHLARQTAAQIILILRVTKYRPAKYSVPALHHEPASIHLPRLVRRQNSKSWFRRMRKAVSTARIDLAKIPRPSPPPDRPKLHTARR